LSVGVVAELVPLVLPLPEVAQEEVAEAILDKLFLD
jgi:hypothetical protein